MPIEGTEHFERHGRKCDGECQNPEKMDCITDSIPGWFKWLTRWHK